MANIHFTAGAGSLWVQPYGPNTQPQYLGCHQIDDIEQPEGDSEPIYCPDPKAPNTFKVVASVAGAPGTITTSLTTDVMDSLDPLERLMPGFALYVNKVDAGRMDVFTNAVRTFILRGCRITNRTLSALAARTPDDNSRSEQSFDLSAEELIRFVKLTWSRQGIVDANSVNDISFCNSERARTADLPALQACQIGYAASDANTVLYTSNGSTWTATSADPFSSGTDVVQAVECFEMGTDAVRAVVADGTADAGGPAKISYTDDEGATWTVVNVGSTNGQYVKSSRGLFALDRVNMWLGTQDGYLYKSSDGGVTWAVQNAGTITSGIINAIQFVNEDDGWFVGDNNIIARTIDGGLSWAAVTGPLNPATLEVNCLAALDQNRCWIGSSDGKLYYTEDGGETWTQRSFIGSGTGSVTNVKFQNELIGYMVRTVTAVSSVLYTIDGGYSWQTMTVPTNASINALFICDVYNVVAAGEAQGGTGYIAKATV